MLIFFIVGMVLQAPFNTYHLLYANYVSNRMFFKIQTPKERQDII